MLAEPHAGARTLAVVLCVLLGGCTPRPLLERAIAARGGPLRGVIMRAETRVYRVVPGRWRYTRTCRSAGGYAWQLDTAAGIDTHTFDGRVVRSFVAGELVGSDTSPSAPLRSQARWTAVSLLDALTAADVVVQPLPAEQLPSGAREGLSAVFRDGAVYRLGFDDATALVWMQGPLDLSPLADGEASVRFGDARPVDGFLVPHRAAYDVGGQHLADEQLLEVCLTPAGLTADDFAEPAALPSCAPAPR
ncbi:MAG: hypothetical protein SF182_18165 [Deltaproteobacteria bacterium]|nr:hypothetical protein [Deltaproteobacteria bacterium]